MMRTFLFYLGYLYYLLLVRTVKVKLVGYDQMQFQWQQGITNVACCAHNSLLAMMVGVDRTKRPIVTALTSLSSDGEIVAKLLSRRGLELVRGSSSRGGKKALLNLQKAALEGKSLGIAFDGPKGPPLIPKRGIIGCARVVKGSLFLIYAIPQPGFFFGYPRAFRVRSWDKFLVPLPFCRITVYFEKLPSQQEAQIQDDQEYENFILKKIEDRSKEVFKGLY